MDDNDEGDDKELFAEVLAMISKQQQPRVAEELAELAARSSNVSHKSITNTPHH
jgi:hypothetical protein